MLNKACSALGSYLNHTTVVENRGYWLVVSILYEIEVRITCPVSATQKQMETHRTMRNVEAVMFGHLSQEK